jgi:opacity protein-like surface antigen
MNKSIKLIIVAFLFIGGAFGENDFIPHKKGDQAMLFEFSGLGFLWADSYRGGIGFKRFINDNTAVRGSLSLRNAKETISWQPDQYPDGTNGEDGSDREFTFGLEVAGEVHRNNAKIDPYYGAGVGFAVTRTKYVAPIVGDQGEYEIKNDLDGNAGTLFSVFTLLGVEYAINSIVSLAAEYQFGFRSISQPNEKITINGDETELEGGKYTFFGITSVGVLTLSIYL